MNVDTLEVISSTHVYETTRACGRCMWLRVCAAAAVGNLGMNTLVQETKLIVARRVCVCDATARDSKRTALRIECVRGHYDVMQ
jgi:hypothetical protein